MDNLLIIRILLFCIGYASAPSLHAQKLRPADKWENSRYELEVLESGGQNGFVPLVLDSFFCDYYDLFADSVEKKTAGYYTYQNDDQQLIFTQFELDPSSTITSGNRELTSYNTQGKKLLTLKQILIAGEWYDYYKDTLIYSAGGQLKEIISQQTSGTDWYNYSKAIFSFDAQGRLDTILGQNWDVNQQNWIDGSFTAYDFNGNDQLLLRRHFQWKQALGQWGIEDEERNVYHPDGRKLAYYHSHAFPGNIFMMDGRDTFLYNANNLNDSIIRIIWDESIAQYRPETAIAYQYDANEHLIYQERFSWENAQWQPKFRSFITPGDYVYSDLPAEEVLQTYNGIDSLWSNSTRQKSAFTPLSNQVVKQHYSYEFADFNLTDWNTSFECDYYYHTKATSVENPEKYALQCAIPNPYPSGSRCQCSGDYENSAADIRIYDPMGRIAVQMNGVNPSEFSLPALPAGMYILVIVQAGETAYIRKVMFSGQ